MLAFVLRIFTSFIAPPEAHDAIDTTEKKKPKKDYDVDVDARLVAGARLISEAPAVDSMGVPIGEPERKGSLTSAPVSLPVDFDVPVVAMDYVSSNLRRDHKLDWL